MTLKSILASGIRTPLKRIGHIGCVTLDPYPKILILVYHRILPEVRANPLNTIVRREAFVKQLDSLAGKFPVVSLSEAIGHCRSGISKNKIEIVLTFDDGYRDNYETAFTLLKRKGLPATFFVSTDYVGSRMPLWDWEIITRIVSDADIDKIETDGYLLRRRRGEPQLSFAFRIFDDMRHAGEAALNSVLDFLREKTPGCEFKDDTFMEWTQIRHMSESGMEIGAHGTSHRSLGTMAMAEALSEIKDSKALIEANTGRDCFAFSFPFGSKRDYNEALIEKVKEARFTACLLNIHGYNHLTPDTFHLKRIIMKEDTNTDFLIG